MTITSLVDVTNLQVLIRFDNAQHWKPLAVATKRASLFRIGFISNQPSFVETFLPLILKTDMGRAKLIESNKSHLAELLSDLFEHVENHIEKSTRGMNFNFEGFLSNQPSLVETFLPLIS